MPRVSTFGLPGDKLGSNNRRNRPQARGASRGGPNPAQSNSQYGTPTPPKPPTGGLNLGPNSTPSGGGIPSFGSVRQFFTGGAQEIRSNPYALARHILGQNFRGFTGDNYGAGINRTISQRNLGYNIAGQERDLLAGQQISQISRDSSLRNTIQGIGLQRTILGQNTALQGDTRALEDRIGFRDHLSSVAGLAQGVQRRARRDLLEARGLRNRSDALGVSQSRARLNLAETQAQDQFGTSGEIQGIRDDLARENIDAYRENETANINDRYSAETHQSRFDIGSLPVYEF